MVFASVTYPSNKNIYTEYDYIQMYKQNNSLTVLVNKLHHTRRDIKYMIHNVTGEMIWWLLEKYIPYYIGNSLNSKIVGDAHLHLYTVWLCNIYVHIGEENEDKTNLRQLYYRSKQSYTNILHGGRTLHYTTSDSGRIGGKGHVYD